MQTDRVVLDTNSLLAALSRRGSAYPAWKGFQEGRYTMCVTTEILLEYEEVIARKTTPQIAANVLRAIIESPHTQRITPHYHWNLVKADPDDCCGPRPCGANKFVDCALAANATYIVSDDAHLDILRSIDCPALQVLRMKAFLERLQTIVKPQ